MKLIDLYTALNSLLARVLQALEPLFALGVRSFVGWQFMKSGWLKLSAWDNTLYLFNEEYHVPVLPPELAAVIGTGGELVFGTLVLLGFAGRAAALGLAVVNVMAVVSYAQVLLAPGFEAALAMHYLWGLMLLVIAVYGPGPWSIDGLMARWSSAAPRLQMHAA